MIKAVLFDIYGTLIEIQTDEFNPATYETLSRYLEYKNIYLNPDQIRWFYHEEFSRRLGTEPARPASLQAFAESMASARAAGLRPYADSDVTDVFRTIVREMAGRSGEETDVLALDLSHLFRSLTRKKMFVYPTVRQGLDTLREKYRLGIVSNAQEAFTFPELDLYGLRPYFATIVLSSQADVKKPDPRIFDRALEALGVQPEETVFVGNDRFADILGAKAVGMKTILVDGTGQAIPGVEPDKRTAGANLIDVAEIIARWND